MLNRFAAVEILKHERGEPTTQQEENNKQQTDFTQKLFQGGKMHVALTANSFDFWTFSWLDQQWGQFALSWALGLTQFCETLNWPDMVESLLALRFYGESQNS